MKRRVKNPRRRALPELQEAKKRVLARLASEQSRRTYRSSIDDFIDWYCSCPRLGFDRRSVTSYVEALKERGLAPSTVNGRLAAIRALAAYCRDSGLIGADALASIMRTTGMKQLGVRTGHWLSPDQARALLTAPDARSARGKRDKALLALLLGCGLRRSEVAALDIEQIRLRDGRWLIVDLVGKGQRTRTVPVPDWVKEIADAWTASLAEGRGPLFRAIGESGRISADRLTDRTVWNIVRRHGDRARVGPIAPHDLRRTCAHLCFRSGGATEQIQFLLGHSSARTTERYLGCRQDLANAVNDSLARLVAA